MSRTNLPPPEQFCVICSKLCVLECIKCETCDKYLHPKCSELPTYALVNWFTTRHKYKCEPCVRTSLDDKEYDRKYAFVANLLISDVGEAMVNENNSDHESSVSEQSVQAVVTAASDNLQKKIIEKEYRSDQERGGFEQSPRAVSIDSNKPNPLVNPPLLSTTSTSNNNNNITNNNITNSVRNSNNNKKTQICKFYKTHSCKYGRSGKKCNYAHPKVCYKYRIYGRDTKKGCTSQTCTHYHPVICKNSEKDRLCLHLDCPHLHLKGTRRYQPQLPSLPTSTHTGTNKPGQPYPPTTHSHATHHQPTNHPTNQYHRDDDLQHINQHFLYLDIQEMKSQLAQLMRLLPIQRDQNLSLQHQQHPVPLPNIAHPPPFLH